MIGRQRGKRDGFVDGIHGLPTRLGIDAGDAVRFGIEIGASGEGGTDAHARAGEGCGDARGGHVLGDIVRIELGDRDFAIARRHQHFDIGDGQNAAFLERAAGRAQGMGENGAHRVGNGNLAELHRAILGGQRPRAAN